MGVTTSSTVAATYEPLIAYTLSSNVSSVTLGSGGQGTIPATYTDLVLVIDYITTSYIGISYQLNGDTSSNYSHTMMLGDYNNAAISTRQSNQTQLTFTYWGTQSTDGRANVITHFMNYANTTTYKTILTRANNAAKETIADVGLWRKTPEAINQIKIISNFASGSTFTLYGVKGA